MKKTLLDFDDPEILASQPVSKAALGNLQLRAFGGDELSDQFLRRHIVALGYYLVSKMIQERNLDREYVLGNIKICELEELRFQHLFTERVDKTMHVRFVQAWLEDVLEKHLYEFINEDLNLRRCDYLYIKEIRQSLLKASGREPDPVELADESGFSEAAVMYVQEKSLQDHIADLQKDLEKIRFLRLQDTLRHAKNVRYLGNLDSLLYETDSYERRILYFYLGLSENGKQKPIEQVATHFRISEERAEAHIRRHLICLVEPKSDGKKES